MTEKELKEAIYHDFGFEIHPLLKEQLGELYKGVINRENHIDCIQDEIRSLAHGYYDDDEGDILIDYYCRRRWYLDKE